MRKEIILPAAAVGGGIAGYFLRRWELATAFEPETGLAIPGMPATWALIALTAAMAVALALLCRGKHGAYPGGYDQAFAAKGNTVYLTAAVVSAFLLLGAAVTGVMEVPQVYAEALAQAQMGGSGNVKFSALLSVVPQVLMVLLAAASGFGILSTGRNNYRGQRKGKYSLPLLLPAYTCCLWLLSAYQKRNGDPVRQDYIYELLAIMAVLLGLYFIAGFSFEKAKVYRAGLFSLLGVYLAIVTLADAHPLPFLLLYCFAILWLTASAVTLLYNDGHPAAWVATQETPQTEEEPHEE